MIDISEHGGNFGGNRSGIKRIRHLSTNWDHDQQLEKTAPILPVIPENTLVMAYSPVGDVGAGYNHFAGILTGPEQLKIIRGYAGGVTVPALNFTLIEFERVKKKQEGMVNSNSTGSYIFNIEPVNIEKSLVLASANHAFGGSTYDRELHAYFTGGNMVRIDGTFSGQKYYWQVIELY